jgi:hypothetical protein
MNELTKTSMNLLNSLMEGNTSMNLFNSITDNIQFELLIQNLVHEFVAFAKRKTIGMMKWRIEKKFLGKLFGRSKTSKKN